MNPDYLDPALFVPVGVALWGLVAWGWIRDRRKARR